MNLADIIIFVTGLIVGAIFGAGFTAKIAMERIKHLDPVGYKKAMEK